MVALPILPFFGSIPDNLSIYRRLSFYFNGPGINLFDLQIYVQMIYASIDIETTGLDPKIHQILEIAIVIEDTSVKKPIEELPTFTTLIRHDNYTWAPEAYKMNRGLFEEILLAGKSVPRIYSDSFSGSIEESINRFLIASADGPIPIAGKNYAGFDGPFLKRSFPIFGSRRFSHRSIDPSILFTDWKNDKTPPSLSECLKRANLPDTVTHRALDDARQVIQLLRTQY